ncbi:MAG: opacity protein-like surface antigen [Paraglaciecola sp.]|jgi:opacity protein-like surface antigen
MKTSTVALLVAASLLVTPAAFAASPDFNYVEGGYTKLDFDNSNFKPDGFKVSGSASVSHNLYLNAAYTDASDGVDYNHLSLGLGYRLSAASNTDVYGMASYEEVERGNFDDNGYGLTAGVRSFITRNIELDGGLSYIDIDKNDETYLNLAVSYSITPRAAVNLAYRTSDDTDMITLSGRYSF